MQQVSHRVARPYTELAAMYDATLGVPFFVGARKAFEESVRRYGINFRSAADIGCGTGLFARYLSRRWQWKKGQVDLKAAMVGIEIQPASDALRASAHPTSWSRATADTPHSAPDARVGQLKPTG